MPFSIVYWLIIIFLDFREDLFKHGIGLLMLSKSGSRSPSVFVFLLICHMLVYLWVWHVHCHWYGTANNIFLFRLGFLLPCWSMSPFALNMMLSDWGFYGLEPLQMMSMGCNPGAVMFPGVQTYMPPMGMGMHMGLGMGMGMGMGLGMRMGTDMAGGNIPRPILPFGPIPCPPVTAHPPVQFGPRPTCTTPLMPSFHPSPAMPIADQARFEAINQQNHLSDTLNIRSPNMGQMPHVVDPFHHFLNLQCPLVQSQVTIFVRLSLYQHPFS